MENMVDLCTHVDGVVAGPLVQRFQSSKWRGKEPACKDCGQRGDDVWVCLASGCGQVACGRTSKGHMLKHYERMNEKKQQGHSLCINTSSGMVWCYTCDRELMPLEPLEPAEAGVTKEAADVLASVCIALVPQLERLARASAPPTTDDAPPPPIATSAVQQQQQQWDAPAAGPASSNAVNIITDDDDDDDLGVVGGGLVGLENLGNTCYMNAALQALSHSAPLRRYFLGNSAYVRMRRVHHVVHSYVGLMESVWCGQNTCIAPEDLVRDVKILNPAFRGFQQQDSQEFLRFLLDRLHEELKHAPPVMVVPPINSPSAEQPAAAVAGKKPTPTPSIVSDIFCGTLESQVTCLECGKSFFSEDPFYDLSVSISPNPKSPSPDVAGSSETSKDAVGRIRQSITLVTSLISSLWNWIGLGSGSPVKLQDCLANFFATEELVGSEQYKCENCKTLTNSTKTFRLAKVPEILCVHLKRFRYDTYFSTKVNTPVHFPLDNLSLKPYCKEGTPAAAEPEQSKYYLYAVVNHRGGIGGGHYVAYARDDPKGRWFEYDDSCVTEKHAREVEHTEAYMLFYRRHTPAAAAKERAKLLAQVQSPVHDGTPTVLLSKLWCNRWLELSSPGPVTTNMLRIATLMNITQDDLAIRVSEPVYQALVAKYGSDGHPPVSALNACSSCEESSLIMTKRREYESTEVARLDSTVLLPGQYWFLVPTVWLKSWTDFKKGAWTLPGPINNAILVDADGTPRPRLVRANDYRGINQAVWEFFVSAYGGGPPVVRQHIELYSDPIPWPPVAAPSSEEATGSTAVADDPPAGPLNSSPSADHSAEEGTAAAQKAAAPLEGAKSTE